MQPCTYWGLFFLYRSQCNRSVLAFPHLAVNIEGFLNGTVQFFGLAYPIYRIFIFICGVLVSLIMASALYKTRLGIILRASVNDSDMVNVLGINVPLLFTGAFAFGAALSGFAGIIAGPLLSTYPGMTQEILVDAFVVIVVGGFGSLGGTPLQTGATTWETRGHGDTEMGRHGDRRRRGGNEIRR